MADVQAIATTQPGNVKLEKVNFFNRQLLTVDDMNTERDYFLQKLRRHNRFLHGWGVVCGLSVSASPVLGSAWRLKIAPGYALGPYGDEIFVGDPVYFDPSACISDGGANSCEPSRTPRNGSAASTSVYLAIKYTECLTRPVRVAPSGCGCDDDACQYSRIRDSFEIECVFELPNDSSSRAASLCDSVQSGIAAVCPPCPPNPWLILAKVQLPTSMSTNIEDSAIDY